MGAVCAQEEAIGLIGEIEVGRITPLSGDEAEVLAPALELHAHAAPVVVWLSCKGRRVIARLPPLYR